MLSHQEARCGCPSGDRNLQERFCCRHDGPRALQACRGQRRFLELDPVFSTSISGPDLVVVFHRSQDVIGSSRPPAFRINDGDNAVLAPLNHYSGAQSDAISGAINLHGDASVAI
ncbi:DM13 domain-containing protein [Synechococcus sp. CBW1107]|uniref:DM13 domain-containing protein n=1 Tax=Synechococcus sp. CBW1107 TaxID=2789857 RepID=UPI003A100547